MHSVSIKLNEEEYRKLKELQEYIQGKGYEHNHSGVIRYLINNMYEKLKG